MTLRVGDLLDLCKLGVWVLGWAIAGVDNTGLASGDCTQDFWPELELEQIVS